MHYCHWMLWLYYNLNSSSTDYFLTHHTLNTEYWAVARSKLCNGNMKYKLRYKHTSLTSCFQPYNTLAAYAYSVCNLYIMPTSTEHSVTKLMLQIARIEGMWRYYCRIKCSIHSNAIKRMTQTHCWNSSSIRQRRLRYSLSTVNTNHICHYKLSVVFTLMKFTHITVQTPAENWVAIMCHCILVTLVLDETENSYDTMK